MSESLAGRRVYLDANVFIYFLDGRSAKAESAGAVLRAAAEGQFQAVTGDAAIAEVLVGPYRTGDPLLVRRVHAFFDQPGLLHVVGHSRGAFEDAAMVRATTDSAFIDALHIATAAEAGCDVLVTSDRRMRSALGVDVVGLS